MQHANYDRVDVEYYDNINQWPEWLDQWPERKLTVYAGSQLGFIPATSFLNTLGGRHNERDDVWNHQPYFCLLDHLFRHR